jgi:hypothetical protein
VQANVFRAGLSVVISFLWGAIAFPHDHPVKNIPLSVLSLILILVGISGLSLSNTRFVKNIGVPPEEERQLINSETENPNERKKNPLLGLFFAVTLALLNGSMMVPLHFVPENAKGINFIVSFGIGVLAVTPVCAIVYFLARRKLPEFHLRVALIPGLITGCIWNIGNYCR